LKPFQIKLPRIKSIWDEEERRVSIPMKTKREVHKRANKRCECCGMPLKMKQGEFHHLRKPTVKSRPPTIQFLCPTHHKLGHKRKTRTIRTGLGETRKEPYIKRAKVRKHPSSPYWKTKRTTRKKKK